MIKALAGCTALTLLVAAPAAAQTSPVRVPPPALGVVPVPADRPVDAETLIRARALAEILGAPDIVVGGDLNRQSDAMAAIWRAVPQMAALEARSPGILDEFAAAITPIAADLLRGRTRDLQDRYAAIYADVFTAPEIDTLIDFYTSSTGQKLIHAMLDNVDYDAISDDLVESGMKSVSTRAALTDIYATLPAVMKTMTSADRAVLAVFEKTSVFARVEALAPRIQRAYLDWSLAIPPEGQARIAAAMKPIAERRLGESPSR